MARYYPYIAGVAGLALIALLLFGPSGGEDARKESTLWEETWSVIEYLPGISEEADAPNARSTVAEEPNLRLIREGGLYADDYFVETRNAAGEWVRRRGGPSVSNIFRDWRKPKLNAYYELNPERRTQSELDRPRHVVRFYDSPGGPPAVLRVGKVTGGANRFVESDYDDHEDLLLIMGGYLFDRFTQDPFSYREKRILIYPAGSHTGEIFLEDATGASIRISLTQEEQPEGPPKNVYRRHDADGKTVEIPPNVASPLDAAVKSMMIQNFRDEPAAREWGDAEALWQQAGKNYAQVKVQIAGGQSYWLHFREAQTVAVEADRILMQSSVSMGTDWARRSAVENALQQMKLLREYEPPKLPQPGSNPGQAGP